MTVDIAPSKRRSMFLRQSSRQSTPNRFTVVNMVISIGFLRIWRTTSQICRSSTFFDRKRQRRTKLFSTVSNNWNETVWFQ